MLRPSLAFALVALVSEVRCGFFNGDFNALAEFAPHSNGRSGNWTGVGKGLVVDDSISLVGAMKKRQNCPTGYGYCYETGRCCPDPNGQGACCDGSGVCVVAGQSCCSAGHGCDIGEDCCQTGCIPEGSLCCNGGFYCDGNEQCCSSTCAPRDAECCINGEYCEAGNQCYIYDDAPGEVFCCTNSLCTAYVENGSTVSQTTSETPLPPPPSSTRRTTQQITQIPTQYYYIVYTWYYYAYYYTLIQATSRVTYTYTSTTTTLSVLATASADASSQAEESFSVITRTPPEDASTELASLVSEEPPEVTQGGEVDVQTQRPTSSSSRVTPSGSFTGPMNTGAVGGGGGEGAASRGGVSMVILGLGVLAGVVGVW